MLNFRPLYFCRGSSSDLPKLLVGLDAWAQVQRGLAPARVGVVGREKLLRGLKEIPPIMQSQGEAVFWGGKKDIPCGNLGRRLAHM